MSRLGRRGAMLCSALAIVLVGPPTAQASTVSYDGGLLRYTGSEAPNTLVVEVDGGHYIFTDSEEITSSAELCSETSEVETIVCQIESADLVLDGGGGADRLHGTAGADELIGGPGADELWGEGGDDVLKAAGDGTDTLHCGAGTDAALVDGTDTADADCELGDSDGDGLLDSWETEELAAMGAHPKRKDVFVELDWMAGHALPPAALQAVQAAFLNAPVANPDGSTGISLHLDHGPGSVMDPRTGATWGDLSAANEIPHADELGSTTAGKYSFAAFHTLAATHLKAARHSVFHYGISAHRLGGQTSLGMALGSQPDFVVSLGPTAAEGGGPDDAALAAGTLMHELGHGLGLDHGGPDAGAYKPNHLSVMSYLFPRGMPTDYGRHLLDFSRGPLPFDEAALDETRGFGMTTAVPLVHVLSASTCPGTNRRVVRPVLAGPTDWNCDGTIASAPVAADVSRDGAVGALAGQSDWDALVFDGGRLGAGATLEDEESELDEPEEAEVDATIDAYDDYLAAHPFRQPAGGLSGGGGDPAGEVKAAPIAALTALRVSPARVRRRAGLSVLFELTAAARVRFTVQRRARGRWRTLAGSFSRSGETGENRFRFNLRVRGQKLRRGRYRLVAAAPAGSRRAAFRVR